MQSWSSISRLLGCTAAVVAMVFGFSSANAAEPYNSAQLEYLFKGGEFEFKGPECSFKGPSGAIFYLYSLKFKDGGKFSVERTCRTNNYIIHRLSYEGSGTWVNENNKLCLTAPENASFWKNFSGENCWKIKRAKWGFDAINSEGKKDFTMTLNEHPKQSSREELQTALETVTGGVEVAEKKVEAAPPKEKAKEKPAKTSLAKIENFNLSNSQGLRYKDESEKNYSAVFVDDGTTEIIESKSTFSSKKIFIGGFHVLGKPFSPGHRQLSNSLKNESSLPKLQSFFKSEIGEELTFIVEERWNGKFGNYCREWKLKALLKDKYKKQIGGWPIKVSETFVTGVSDYDCGFKRSSWNEKGRKFQDTIIQDEKSGKIIYFERNWIKDGNRFGHGTNDKETLNLILFKHPVYGETNFKKIAEANKIQLEKARQTAEADKFKREEEERRQAVELKREKEAEEKRRLAAFKKKKQEADRRNAEKEKQRIAVLEKKKKQEAARLRAVELKRKKAAEEKRRLAALEKKKQETARRKAKKEKKEAARLAAKANADKKGQNGKPSLDDRMATLKRLKDAGLLSEEQFQAKTNAILNEYLGLGGPSKTASAQKAKPSKYADVKFGKYYALVIGNNDYKHLPKLKTAAKDAKAVAKTLRDTFGFEVKTLINATRSQILDAFDDYQVKLGKTDNFLLYYAGHGWLDKGQEQGFWLPVNAKTSRRSQWISNATVTSTLKALQAKHVMVVADSCFSGTLTRGLKVEKRIDDYVRHVVDKRARIALTSGGLEPVEDGGGGKNSPFASAFLKILNGSDEVLSGTELFKRVKRPVQVNADQTPNYSDIRKAGHDGGDFLFVRKR